MHAFAENLVQLLTLGLGVSLLLVCIHYLKPLEGQKLEEKLDDRHDPEGIVISSARGRINP